MGNLRLKAEGMLAVIWPIGYTLIAKQM